jgi:hypothetical protein
MLQISGRPIQSRPQEQFEMISGEVLNRSPLAEALSVSFGYLTLRWKAEAWIREFAGRHRSGIRVEDFPQSKTRRNGSRSRSQVGEVSKTPERYRTRLKRTQSGVARQFLGDDSSA